MGPATHAGKVWLHTPRVTNHGWWALSTCGRYFCSTRAPKDRGSRAPVVGPIGGEFCLLCDKIPNFPGLWKGCLECILLDVGCKIFTDKFRGGNEDNVTPSLTSQNPRERINIWETFELNWLKSALSQLLTYQISHNFTGCRLVAINLDRPMSYIVFQVPANFFFIVMTTNQELGHW
jgi:hypothetical protein